MSCQSWFLWPLTYPCSLNLGLAEAPGPNGTQLSGASTKNLSEEPCPGMSSDSCQVHQRKTTQDQGDSLTDWPANTNLLTPDVEHVEQCSKAIFLQESNLQDQSKITNRENFSVEPSPPRQQLIFFLQRRPGTLGACCCTCYSTVHVL